MQPILLMCHWHTGSRFLTKLFYEAGMEVGNEKTGWVDCKPGQEHPDLSKVGNTLYLEALGRLQHSPKIERLEKLKGILELYKQQGWNCFGVKNNFFGNKDVWNVVGLVVFNSWPNVKIVISVRHPIDIHRTANNPEWSLDDVVGSFRQTYEVTKELVTKGTAKLIIHPDSFEDVEKIKELIEWAGLEWKDSLASVFDLSSVNHRATKEERIEFAKNYLDAEQEFVDLCAMANGKWATNPESKTFGSSTSKKRVKGKKNG